MKVILPNFDSDDTIDLSGLTSDYLVVAYKNGKPFGVLMTDDDTCEYWIQTTMRYPKYDDSFCTIYEAIEDFVGQYPDVTFEAYL